MAKKTLSWGEIKALVGEDSVATAAFILLDELARELGKSVTDYAHPYILLDELAGGYASIETRVMDDAEWRAICRFAQEWAELPEPDWGDVWDAVWDLR
jgi:transaldolase